MIDPSEAPAPGVDPSAAGTPEAVADAAPAPPPPADATDRITWLWVLAATLVGLGLRLWFVVRLHPPAQYVYSDMEGFLNQARTFAEPHHQMGLWDTVKPRAMGLTGALVLRL